MSQRNVEIVRSCHEAFGRRDMETIEALVRQHVAAEFEFESALTGQVYRGAQGIMQLPADLWETLDYVAATEEIIDSGEHVLVMLRISGRGAHSGVPVSQRVAVVWTFEGQRIIRGKSFTSRAEALEAVGPSE